MVPTTKLTQSLHKWIGSVKQFLPCHKSATNACTWMSLLRTTQILQLTTNRLMFLRGFEQCVKGGGCHVFSTSLVLLLSEGTQFRHPFVASAVAEQQYYHCCMAPLSIVCVIILWCARGDDILNNERVNLDSCAQHGSWNGNLLIYQWM